jgi:hypothetical protein
MNFRLLHRRVAKVVLPLLAISAVTGLTFRIGRVWFGMSEETGAAVRSIHDAKILADWFSPFYVLVVGLGLLTLAGSGLTMVRRRNRAAQAPRHWHRMGAVVLVLPLAASALTGIGFRLSQAWFGWTTEQAQWLLDIHQGTLLFGRDYRAYYVIFVGVGLLALITTGASMLNWYRARQ